MWNSADAADEVGLSFHCVIFNPPQHRPDWQNWFFCSARSSRADCENRQSGRQMVYHRLLNPGSYVLLTTNIRPTAAHTHTLWFPAISAILFHHPRTWSRSSNGSVSAHVVEKKMRVRSEHVLWLRCIVGSINKIKNTSPTLQLWSSSCMIHDYVSHQL